jgi:cytoskeleton protein RodZ
VPSGERPAASTPDRPTPGTALRAAREEARMTVEQVSSETRLRGTVIRDLEADSYRSSGGSVYARGHVKSIARALGLEPEPFLALFDAHAGSALPETPPLEDQPAAPVITSFGGSAFAGATAALVPERHGPRWGLAVAAAGAVLATIIGVGYLNQPSPADRPLAGNVLPTNVATATTAPTQTPDPNAVAARPEVTGAQLRVRLINGTSWVSVSDSTGKTVFEGILKNGDFRDFSDPSRLKILVGNALAVNLNCDGHDSGPAGGSGMVAKFACTPDGLTAL